MGRASFWFLAVAVSVAIFMSPSVRTTDHRGCVVVTSDNNNHLSVFNIDSLSGALRDRSDAPTDGFGIRGGYFASPQIALTRVSGAGFHACGAARNAGSNSVTPFALTKEPT